VSHMSKPKWIKGMVVVCSLALVAAACGGDDDDADTADTADTASAPADDTASAPADDTSAPVTEPSAVDSATSATATAPAGDNPYGATLADGEFGETYNPDEATLNQTIKGIGGLPVDEMSKNIVLATFARAAMPIDEDKALECWQSNDCETGTGGDLIVGLADGFGGNVPRQLFKMEFIMQALTYPEIGRIIYTDANLDTQKAISDVRGMLAQGVDVIISYPDAGEAMIPIYQEATAANVPVALWAGANIGEQGVDYMTTTGRDYCAIGKANAKVINEALPDGGKLALLGGTPGNTTSPQWQKCEKEALNANIEVVATADTSWTPQGTLEAMSGILSADPDVAAVSYDYGGGFVGAISAYEAAGIPMDIVATVETDENSLFCAWKDTNNPNFKLWTFVAATYESRMGLTAAMMQRAGAVIPPDVTIQAALAQVTPDSCNEDAVADAPPSSLVSLELQAQMFG
jgi:ribose transport system substrate-binding protein